MLEGVACQQRCHFSQVHPGAAWHREPAKGGLASLCALKYGRHQASETRRALRRECLSLHGCLQGQPLSSHA